MSSISPTGPRGVNLDPAAAADTAPAAAAPAAPAPAPLTRIPGPGRPTIPTTIPMPGTTPTFGGAKTLGTDVEHLMDRASYDDLKAMVRNSLRVANSRSLERGPMTNALNDTIESLARQRKLDGFILMLEQGAPDLHNAQPIRAEIQAFLDRAATPGSKRAWGEESLAATKPTSGNLIRDVTEGVNLGVDSLAGLHVDRLLTTLRGTSSPPTADAVKLLDQTIVGLGKKKVLDNMLMSMMREADGFVRDHPNVMYYPPHMQLNEMVEAHGSAETKKVWKDAVYLAQHKASESGADVGARVAEALGRSSDQEAFRMAGDFFRAPSDSPKSIAIMNDAVAELKKRGKLDDFVRSIDRQQGENLSVLFRQHPGIRPMIYPLKNMIADALDRSGSPEAKAAWGQAVRNAGSPTGYERAADAAAALRGGEDAQVAAATDEMLALVNVHPPERPRKEDLTSMVLSLNRQGRLDDFVASLKRVDQKSGRDAPPNVRIAARLSLFDAAVDKFGTAAAKAAWGRVNP